MQAPEQASSQPARRKWEALPQLPLARPTHVPSGDSLPLGQVPRNGLA